MPTDNKTAYLNWLASQKKSKAKLTQYKCPECSITLETLTPPKGDIYDSLVSCPFCANPHYKIVQPDGNVLVN